MPSFTSIALEDATAQQRFTYARTILGLELDETDSDEQVISQIRQAQPQSNMIFVEETVETPEPEQQTPPGMAEALQEQATGIQGTRGLGDPRAVINIPPTDRADGGKSDVAVGVNGFVWQLKRGVDLDVPYRVVEALRLTMETVIEHDSRPEHEGEVIESNVTRVPFSVITGPSPDEIKAWKERVANKFCP